MSEDQRSRSLGFDLHEPMDNQLEAQSLLKSQDSGVSASNLFLPNSVSHVKQNVSDRMAQVRNDIFT